MSPQALHLDAVAARVVAWHNRHPLARRIALAQVGHLGVVTLPFVVPPADPDPDSAPVLKPNAESGSADAAADAPAVPSGQSRLRRWARKLRWHRSAVPHGAPAFDEDFLPPWRPAALARWAERHGEPDVAPPADIPVRAVPVSVDPALPTRTVGVASAAIDLGALKSRVLIGNGHRAAILGRRLWSPVRLSIAALLSTAALGVGFVGLHVLHTPADQPHAAATPAAAPQAVASTAAAVAAASAASAPAATLAEQPAPPHDKPPAEAHLQAQAADTFTQATKPSPSPSQPQPQPPKRPQPLHSRSLGTAAQRPAIRPTLDDDSKAAARDAVAQARKELGLPEPVTASAAAAPTASGAAPSSAMAAAESTPRTLAGTAPGTLASTTTATSSALTLGPAFALSTRTLRTRAEAEQVMAAARALLATVRSPGSAALQVEVLPVGDDWRVAAFPYPRKIDAERAVALLASRGMRVTVVDF
ncbi:MAG: hypothetical protein ABIN96_15525 [Rubrivivax sp.]